MIHVLETPPFKNKAFPIGGLTSDGGTVRSVDREGLSKIVVLKVKGNTNSVLRNHTTLHVKVMHSFIDSFISTILSGRR